MVSMESQDRGQAWKALCSASLKKKRRCYLNCASLSLYFCTSLPYFSHIAVNPDWNRTKSFIILYTALQYHTHTHTHTHTHVGFYGLRGLSIGVMVFILYKLYVLLPYTYPTPKLSPHRRRCISTFPQKTHSVWFISVLNYGDTENVLINHLLLVIPMLYPCHYTNLCPHKPHKHAHTHTHSLSICLFL